MRIRVWTTAALLLIAPVLIALTQGLSMWNGAADTLLYISKQPSEYEIHMVDMNRRRLDLTRKAVLAGEMVWSPDYRSLAFLSYWDSLDGNNEVYVTNIDTSVITNLSNHPGNDRSPVWSPDGTRIAFVSERDGNSEIYVVDADGQNLHNLTNHPASDQDPQWSPDGTMIAFTSQREGNHDIFVMNADGSNPRNLTLHPAREYDPVWSPDSRRIAFISSRDDGLEIYVVNVHTEALEQVSDIRGSAINLVWQSD